MVQIYPFHCVEISYQSADDWSLAWDILRCNPDFFHAPRYDNMLLNIEGEDLCPARLIMAFRAKLAGSEHFLDLALIQRYRHTKNWKPRTLWHGCQVFSEDKNVPSYPYSMPFEVVLWCLLLGLQPGRGLCTIFLIV